jgi:futalosine hydrolase
VRLVVVTPGLAERDAVLRDLGPAQLARLAPYDDTRVAHPSAGTIVVVPSGVGAPAAAAAAGVAINRLRPDAVLAMGLAGGFAGRASSGSVVVADRIVAADLGADSPDGFRPLEQLGLGISSYDVSAHLSALARARIAAAGLDVAVGAVLTVATATGTAARLHSLAGRHASAVAEAMEGAGVAVAAAAHGVPVLEVRAVSNAVGPRGADPREVEPALDALSRAARALFAGEPWPGLAGR